MTEDRKQMMFDSSDGNLSYKDTRKRNKKQPDFVTFATSNEKNASNHIWLYQLCAWDNWDFSTHNSYYAVFVAFGRTFCKKL